MAGIPCNLREWLDDLTVKEIGAEKEAEAANTVSIAPSPALLAGSLVTSRI